MKTLSIRQPWAWLILHAGKDVENRDWPTKVRGPILIHAAKGMTRAEYLFAACDYEDIKKPEDPALPSFEQLERGGIVGQVEITGVCAESASPWFCGKLGFLLANPKPLPFRPYRGMLGFFEVAP